MTEKMRKKYDRVILLSDMDGTLLDREGNISLTNRMAIREFMGGGGRFGIATGRSHLNFEAFLGDMEVNAPCILYNGCALYERQSGSFLELFTLPVEKLSPYLSYCLQAFPELMVQVYCPDLCHIISAEAGADREVVENHRPVCFSTLQETMEKPWIKLLISGEPQRLHALEAMVDAFGLRPEISWVYSQERYLEILPAEVSKGSMLETLRKRMGDGWTIYAVGDYNNDIEMLKAADVGIATANALPAVKAAADALTVSNEESAIAHIIRKIIL